MTDPVVIVGAGIGGLTAALALGRKGHRVVVFERADALKEVGAGLQLSPNATHCLDLLGVLAKVRQTAFEPASVRIRSAVDGRDLARVPLAPHITERYAAPYLVVHRADLQKALFDKAAESGAIEIRFGHSFAGYSVETAGLAVSFGASDGTQTALKASVLVGADGVWSKVRTTVPGHADARFSGRTAYRATIPASKVDPDVLTDTGLWLGAKAHLVHYPVRGGQEFNIVALVAEDWQEETWSAPANAEALRARFSNWSPAARDLISKPESWLKWALCGVSAKASWVSPRVALLGDAAHGMLPFAAQGAAMAIEDAMVLADALAPRSPDVTQALNAYQARRQARAAKVQATASKNGHIYHMSGPLAFARDAVLRMSSPHSLSQRMDWIYGWRPPQ